MASSKVRLGLVLPLLLVAMTAGTGVNAHHIADIDAETSEYWATIHGRAWLTCVEQYIAVDRIDDPAMVAEACGDKSTMPPPTTY